MSLSRSNCFALCLAFALVALLAFTDCAPSASARGREEPAFATSADDAALRNRLAALSPNVRPEEAQRVARCAYTTGRELKREWQVVWPPGLQNFLVNTGARKGGLCFQWATELLLRLDALKLETLELHWAESFERTASEHNVIVVTARGSLFSRAFCSITGATGDVSSGGLSPGTPTISGRKTKRKLSADWENDEPVVAGLADFWVLGQTPERARRVSGPRFRRVCGKQIAHLWARRSFCPMQTSLNATICVSGNNYQTEDSMPENIRQAFERVVSSALKAKRSLFVGPDRTFHSEAQQQDRL